MNRGMSQPFNRLAVDDGAITLVTRQPVAGILLVQFTHHRITRGLGEDGGGGDAQGLLVAFDDGGEGDVGVGVEAEICQQVIGEEGERGEGAFGRETRRGGDAEGVDLVGGGPAEGPGAGNFAKDRGPAGALGGSHLLGVAHPAQSRGKTRDVWEDDRAHGDGSGQGAASGFVHPGDVFQSAAPESFFEAQVRGYDHSRRGVRCGG